MIDPKSDFIIVSYHPVTSELDQLAEYTLKLFTDEKLRNKIGIKASKHALKNFNYNVITKKMIDFINESVLNS